MRKVCKMLVREVWKEKIEIYNNLFVHKEKNHYHYKADIYILRQSDLYNLPSQKNYLSDLNPKDNILVLLFQNHLKLKQSHHKSFHLLK